MKIYIFFGIMIMTDIGKKINVSKKKTFCSLRTLCVPFLIHAKRVNASEILLQLQTKVDKVMQLNHFILVS